MKPTAIVNRTCWAIAALLVAQHAAAQTAVLRFPSMPQYEVTQRAAGRCTIEVSPMPDREEGAAIRSSTTRGGRQEYVLMGSGDCAIARDHFAIQVEFKAAQAAKALEVAAPALVQAPAAAPTPAAAPAAAAASDAASDKKPTPKEIFQKYAIDMTVPESPAFTLIGLKTEDVKRPASVRELAVALVNGTDESGKPKTGLAIDFAPFQQFSDIVDLTNYTKPDAYVTRALANTNLSFGTAAGTSASDKSTKFGFGVETILFDRGDVRADLALWNCLTSVELPTPGALPTTDEQRKVAEDKLRAMKAHDDKVVKNCLETNPTVAASKRWNRSAASAALGMSWTSEDGTYGSAKAQTKGAWISWAYGFEGVAMLEDRAQLLFHARRLLKERVADPDDDTKMINRDASVGGVKIRAGSSNFNASLEWSYQWLKPEGKGTDRVRRVALGLEYKLSDSIWLVAAAGGEGGYQDGKSHSFVLGSLRFAPCMQDSCRVLK